MFFFFKQKTAYEMRISDWSSDVCSSDLRVGEQRSRPARAQELIIERAGHRHRDRHDMREDEGVGSHVGKTHLRRAGAKSSGVQRLAGGDEPRPAMYRPGRLDKERMRVVCGTIVTVQVEIGGRRSIKKTKKTKR